VVQPFPFENGERTFWYAANLAAGFTQCIEKGAILAAAIVSTRLSAEFTMTNQLSTNGGERRAQFCRTYLAKIRVS